MNNQKEVLFSVPGKMVNLKEFLIASFKNGKPEDVGTEIQCGCKLTIPDKFLGDQPLCIISHGIWVICHCAVTRHCHLLPLYCGALLELIRYSGVGACAMSTMTVSFSDLRAVTMAVAANGSGSIDWRPES